MEILKNKEENIDLADSEIIVSGGRGLGEAKNFSLISDLAKALGGVVVLPALQWMPIGFLMRIR